MDLFVVADDRTGALETAAAIAHRTGVPVPVVTPGTGVAASTVIDIGSRHLPAGDAARRAVAALSRRHDDTGAIAHKMDSTLRGNWDAEAVALSLALDRPVLVVAALPEMGRVCRGGLVFDHDELVHEGPAGTDARGPIRSSRPAEYLIRGGARTVRELATAEVPGWLADLSTDAPERRGGWCAVADAGTQADIAQITRWWAEHADGSGPVPILVGTSAVIAAAVAREPVSRVPVPGVAPGRRVLVACGSQHPMALAQLTHAASHAPCGLDIVRHSDLGATDVASTTRDVAIVPTLPPGTISESDAVRAAGELGADVHALLALDSTSPDSSTPVPIFGVLVVIGGDTAAAIFGDARMLVLGAPTSGTALVSIEGIEVPVIARAGGFGDETSLSELLAAIRREAP